jgi:predicted RNA-binding protein with PUA-like domain
MAYWLLKSEAESWSWDQQKKAGAKALSGPACATFRRPQQHGDEARRSRLLLPFGADKAVVGIVKVVKEANPDSTDQTGQWECVDVAAVADLPQPVTLAAVKANPKLKDMVLARVSRLSVQPVSSQEWSMICKLGGLTKPPQG